MTPEVVHQPLPGLPNVMPVTRFGKYRSTNQNQGYALGNPISVGNTIVGQLSMTPKIVEVVCQPLPGLLWLELLT